MFYLPLVERNCIFKKNKQKQQAKKYEGIWHLFKLEDNLENLEKSTAGHFVISVKILTVEKAEKT
jgi:hypothetical protein